MKKYGPGRGKTPPKGTLVLLKEASDWVGGPDNARAQRECVGKTGEVDGWGYRTLFVDFDKHLCVEVAYHQVEFPEADDPP